MTAAPTIAMIEATRQRIAPYVIETPTLPYYGCDGPRRLGEGTEVWLKLELLQRTGSFKPRGALNVMLDLSAEERACGITALSAGNHAIATAYAAQVLGLSAKVVMPLSANPFRIELCRSFGAEIVFADNLGDLFRIVERLEAEEGRVQIHPFEGPRTFEGTATVGWEICRDAPELDAVIVPVGGGGLIAGIASAVKLLRPACRVFGVEPVGAQGMTLSLAAGEALPEVPVKTIADSLGPPFHTPGAFSLVQRFVDAVVTVEDRDLVEAMALMFGDLKLAVEPAGAAALAALLGPLKARLAGKRVGLVVCGANIDVKSYGRLLGLGPS
jgi:threonine dehydratase